jgi:hypothetical protein
MAEVKIIPKVSCDNCGIVIDKLADKYSIGAGGAQAYSRPREWGSCRIEGTRDGDIYGNKERLDFADLCPDCAHSVFIHAAGALADRRRENDDE